MMEPLSCVNCCHNPLQLGPTGTTFGYCTRHRVVLRTPHLLTCGQLLRKDVYGDDAEVAQQQQRGHYPHSRPALLTRPKDRAGAAACTEKPNGHLPPDAVVEEAVSYGRLPTKIASMAALRRIPGARAEVAMVSLARGYVRNCVRQNRRWTSGLHLMWWSLERLAHDPVLEATDLRESSPLPIERVVALAKWYVIVHRLIFISEAAAHAHEDPVADLATLAEDAVIAARVGAPDDMLRFLGRPAIRTRIGRALSRERYEALSESLRPRG